MTRQLIVPPAHVWDRIEKILDEQDAARAETNKLIFDSFRKAKNIRRFNFFIASFLGAGFIALLLLKYIGNLKEI